MHDAGDGYSVGRGVGAGAGVGIHVTSSDSPLMSSPLSSWRRRPTWTSPPLVTITKPAKSAGEGGTEKVWPGHTGRTDS